MYSGQPMFQQELWGHGPAPGQFYNFPAGNALRQTVPTEFTRPGIYGTSHSFTPATMGSSVVGITFDGGVMIAADNLVSYGSLARFQDIQRVFKINDNIIIGAAGEFADFQSIKRAIDQQIVEDMCYQDESYKRPKELYSWLTRRLYTRRSNMNPCWLDIIVGGMEKDGPFLGHIDKRGRAYHDNAVVCGFGMHLALPLLREQLKEGKKLTLEQASELLHKCMEVLYYRDCRAMSKYTLGVCTKDGCVIKGPINVSQNWQLATMVKGY